MTYFGLFTVMFFPQKIILYWYVSIDIMAPLSRPFGWSDWEYRFLFSVIKQDCKFFNLLLTCYSLFIRWGHEYDPGDFSAFKLSSLVFSKKYYAHGYQHENDISYFNFLLAHTASCLGAVRVTLSFFWIILSNCTVFNTLLHIFIIRNILFIF